MIKEELTMKKFWVCSYWCRWSEWAVITCTAKFKAPANGSYRSARSHRSLPSQLRELSTSRSSVKSILLKCVQESIRAPEIHDSLVNHRRGPDRAHRKNSIARHPGNHENRAAAQEFALWPEHGWSAYVWSHCCVAHDRCVAGVLPACAPRDESRSAGGAAIRM